MAKTGSRIPVLIFVVVVVVFGGTLRRIGAHKVPPK